MRPRDTLFEVQDLWPFLLLLLLSAAIVIIVQSLRLRRQRGIADAQREIARANQAAATREEERRVITHARSLRAVDGERSALAVLERAGYEVVERQVPGSWTVRADGEPVTFGLRADYLVAREGRRYIAEVKTGRLAPRLAHGPTRRQLLEYSAAFDVEGVILVDADAETITHVEIDLFDRNAPDLEVDAFANLAVRNDASSVDVRGVSPRAVAIVAVVCFSIGVIVGTAVGK
jgi:hypothetical protein